MKQIIFIFLMMLSFSAFSESKLDSILRSVETKKFDTEKMSKDIDTLKYQAKDIGQNMTKIKDVYAYEIKTFGLKKTIQMNYGIFVPFIIFLLFYLLCLKNSNKK